MTNIVILGPTASGKTNVAAHLAFQLDAEIISADSRQVYREMNIGTGKDLDSYLIENTLIPYHLIDIVDAGESYHIAQFQKDVANALENIALKNKPAIVCGGSGMYIESLLKSFDYTQVPVDESLRNDLETKSNEELARIFEQNQSSFNTVADISTRKRLIRAIEINHQIIENAYEYKPQAPILSNYKVFGLAIEAEERRKKIDERLVFRLKNGMIDEVKYLLEKGISPEKLIFYGLEYKFITQYILGEMPYNEMVGKLQIAIHQFAKRQMTYFRSMERKGILINWIDAQKQINLIIDEIKSFI